MILILVVVTLVISRGLILIHSRRRLTESEKFRKEANRILDRLLNSQECLAAEGGVIDSRLLERFQSAYRDIEPECARSYDYGYYVKVEESDPSRRVWVFGSTNYSEGKALKESISLSVPVRISTGNEVRAGSITLRMYRGELEKLVGLIDKTCERGLEIVKKMGLSYPVKLKDKSLCMEGEEEFCRKFACNLRVDFEEVENPGNYTFLSRLEWDTIRIELR